MEKGFSHLLAKNSKSPESPSERETLTGHILEVVKVADALVGTWGDRFIATMGLPKEWDALLRRAILRGAFLHDLGKANNQFQRMVRSSSPPQALRHEWISLLTLLKFDELNQWLFPDGDDLTRKAALCATVGHHLKFRDGSVFSPRPGSDDPRVHVMMGHRDVADLLKRASEPLDLSSAAPQLKDFNIDILDFDPSEVSVWVLQSNNWWSEAHVDERHFVALVKAVLVASDLAGSALPRAGIKSATWAQEVISRTCQAKELQGLATRSLDGKPTRAFQDKVANSKGRVTLIQAGCGSGKTTAAYLWGANNAGGRKLFFCYPTTGTATEGYADYVLPDDMEARARLIHSRAEVDLEDLLEAYDDLEEDGAESYQVRIEALSAWDVPFVVCTADTVLGLVQNSRRGLFSFPSIASGAFVFDEIHAYDERLFGALLRFLEAFSGVPVLLMTASLQEARQRELTRVVGKLEEIEGPRDLEQIKRYTFSQVEPDDVWADVEQALASQGKVLWVANTVVRAVQFAREAGERGLEPVLPYHSRYRYIDRVEKHRAVIEAFRGNGPVLAVTTQVCEVSLDLSADLLVTDVAPIPSLIQRLGRLNRRVTLDQPGDPKRALFLQPEQPMPYKKSDFQATHSWIELLGSGPFSQSDLAEAFLQVADASSTTGTVTSAWLDGGPFSRAAPLREAGHTVPVIRGEDAAGCQDGRGRVLSNQVVRMSIPMLLGPVAKEIASWPRLSIARVTPLGRIEYSERWGAEWRRGTDT